MAKFNVPNSHKTTNQELFKAYLRPNAKFDIISVVLNSMLNGDKYYETEADRFKSIEELFLGNMNDPLFLLKLMVYTRNEINLRSVSHVMAVLSVENIKGIPEVKKALQLILVRPDDATEIVSLWNHRHPNSMIPNSLRRAIKNRLENKWDAYQLKKYYGTGSVKVSDLIKIAHPSSENVPMHSDYSRIWKHALEGTLPNIETAQTVNAGTTGEERAEAYKKMLIENKLGIMAALKNVRNIVEAKLDEENLNMLSNIFTDKNKVEKSRLLPFRFAQAYNAVFDMEMDMFVKNALLQMIDEGFMLSARNIPFVSEDERVAILLDESSSMGDYGSVLDQKAPFYIGKTLMAAMVSGLNKDNVVGMTWANNVRTVNINKTAMEFVRETKSHGGGTNLAAAMDVLVQSKTHIDKIVIFTDMQENRLYGMYGSRKNFRQMVDEYKTINPNVTIIFWNLAGYRGGIPIQISDNVVEVAGYSDKMLEVLPKMMEDKNALVTEIMEVKI